MPAFLGFGGAPSGEAGEPHRLTAWPHFAASFPEAPLSGPLAAAVRGFFDNGGGECRVLSLGPGPGSTGAWGAGLDILAAFDDVDLVCAPDAFADPAAAAEVQGLVIGHCDDLGDRFGLLDALPDGGGIADVLAQRAALVSRNAALYHPWLRPRGAAAFVPPCGHVAGMIARTDERRGVHEAPANEVLEGVVELAARLGGTERGELHRAGVNPILALPGRGIRVWGARTLRGEGEAEWSQVNVRRLVLTAGRWIERHLAGAVFEPHDRRLRARLERELGAYFTGLWERGALVGATPREAFYVRCDAETNPPEVRATGRVVTEINLAPALPGERVVIRLVHAAGGLETMEI